MTKEVDEIMEAFTTKFNDEFTIYPNEAGKTLENMIVHQKAVAVRKAVVFTLEYVLEKFKNE